MEQIRRYSIDDVNNALTEVEELYVGGAHSDQEIIAAQEALLVELPDSFKQYLKRWGSLSLGPIEYYGLTKSSDFESAGVPNFVWFTRKKRGEVDLPKNLVVFQNTNDEVYHCLDTSSPLEGGECKISRWDNIHRNVDTVLEINFFEFLLDDIEEYIEAFQ